MQELNIHTERLHIRNLKLTDLDNFYFYRSNPDITKHQGFDVMNMVEAADFISIQKDKLFGKPNQWVQYGIENKKTNLLIGDCAIKISALNNGTASVGITIAHTEQRKGYAYEVLQHILLFLFAENNIHRVVETLTETNIASEKLLIASGFRKEGLFIAACFSDNKWINTLQYAMLKREWLDLLKKN